MLSLIGAITIGVGTVYGYYRHKNNQSAINIQENAEDLAKTVASDVVNQVGKLKDKVCGKSPEPFWTEA